MRHIKISLLLTTTKKLAMKFTSKLSSVKAGQVITVVGKTTAGAKRFVVELAVDVETTKEAIRIPFHMSVRIPESVIVRNSRDKGCWSRED